VIGGQKAPYPVASLFSEKKKKNLQNECSGQPTTRKIQNEGGRGSANHDNQSTNREQREGKTETMKTARKPRKIQNAPDVLVEVAWLLSIHGPVSIEGLMNQQVNWLRRRGRPGRLFDRAKMQSAVTDLVWLGVARETGFRFRKGERTYGFSTADTAMVALKAGDIDGAVRIANERWRHNNEVRMAATETPDNFRGELVTPPAVPASAQPEGEVSEHEH